MSNTAGYLLSTIFFLFVFVAFKFAIHGRSLRRWHKASTERLVKKVENKRIRKLAIRRYLRLYPYDW